MLLCVSHFFLHLFKVSVETGSCGARHLEINEKNINIQNIWSSNTFIQGLSSFFSLQLKCILHDKFSLDFDLIDFLSY